MKSALPAQVALPPLDAPAPAPQDRRGLSGPSALYRPSLWRACVTLARVTPPSIFTLLARGLAALYWAGCPARRAVVQENLHPLFQGDRTAANRATRELFRQFAFKLADLWRYESGRPIEHLFQSVSGWEHFEAAHARGRGVLLLTVHLGNWEFGAPLLTRRGVNLQVITQAEPQARLTEIRQAARARRGVATLPLDGDPFAAIEVIRRLEANHAVALLLDRPPRPTATRVTLFGQPFDASIAAAEFARATGCALLPVYVPRTRNGYSVHTLADIPYERATLRDPAARVQLTQRILSTFEPVIARHPSQWFHFVPIWPAPTQAASPAANETAHATLVPS